jgi:hypothetical protein
VDPEFELVFHLAVAGKRRPLAAVQVVADMLRTLAGAHVNAHPNEPGSPPAAGLLGGGQTAQVR